MSHEVVIGFRDEDNFSGKAKKRFRGRFGTRHHVEKHNAQKSPGPARAFLNVMSYQLIRRPSPLDGQPLH